MEQKHYFGKSKFFKIFYFFTTLLGILFLYFSIKSSQAAYIMMIFFIFATGSLVIFYTYLIRYNFQKEIVSYKYPFFSEKSYKINEIIGWKFTYLKNANTFDVFFENKMLSIDISSKKSREVINNFINDNYDIIKNHNIEKIKTEGYTVKINKKSSIIFYENDLMLVNYKNKNYPYSDIVGINIDAGWIGTVNIFMKDGNKIKFNSFHCKGGIGLFEYLNNINTNPNVA